jgi:hypothetical protein
MKGVKQDMRYISPEPLLPILAKHWGLDPHSEAMAKKLDSIDKLGKFRKYFSYPMKKNCIRGEFSVPVRRKIVPRTTTLIAIGAFSECDRMRPSPG